MVHFLFWWDWLQYKIKYGIPQIPVLVQIHHWKAEEGRWDEFRRALTGATMLGVSSKHWQEILKENGFQALLMPLGTDKNIFKPSQLYSKPYPLNPKPLVGWLGNPSERKNLDHLKAACKYANCELVINDSHKNRMTLPQLVKWYQNLDFYASTAPLEGGPMPVIEALACGIPTVMVKTGMWQELMMCKHFYVNDRAHFTTQFKLIVGLQMGQKHHLIQAGKELGEQLDWKNVVKYYKSAYKHTLEWREIQ